MHSEAKETARLYATLTDKLGSETAEAMFKYIDGKTERSVEVSIKSLATKDDLATTKDDLRKEISIVKNDLVQFRDDLRMEIGVVKNDLTLFRDDLRKEISIVRKEAAETKADMIKWMFIFWIGQVGATLGILLLFLKK